MSSASNRQGNRLDSHPRAKVEALMVLANDVPKDTLGESFDSNRTHLPFESIGDRIERRIVSATLTTTETFLSMSARIRIG